MCVCVCVCVCVCACACHEPCLRESPVVPDVAMVGKAVVHEANLALLHILLDWVQRLLFVDLKSQAVPVQPSILGSPPSYRIRKVGAGGRAVTSIFALVQRGISTTMLTTGPGRSGNREMSCSGEMYRSPRSTMSQSSKVNTIYNSIVLKLMHVDLYSLK